MKNQVETQRSSIAGGRARAVELLSPDAASCPLLRLVRRNQAPVQRDGDYVLYWMIGQRRLGDNFALQRAIAWAQALRRPLLILEPLRADYRWASARIHRFVLDGMAANARAAQAHEVAYYPYVEPERGAAKGLLAALAERAALVVTDELPVMFLPRAIQAGAQRSPVLVEGVDGGGVLPLAATEQVFSSAHSFRRYLHKELVEHLMVRPLADPLAKSGLPPLSLRSAGLRRIQERWPAASAALLGGDPSALAQLPIDQQVHPVELKGGAEAGADVLRRFLRERLPLYAESRNQPDEEVTSGLSPYLHFGHLSIHRVVAELLDAEGWSPLRVSRRGHGQRSGWWGVSEAAESFLDEAITWRELGLNFCAKRPDYDRYESLPEWAKATLEAHAGDPRPHLYSLEELERAETHDELWNAAQRQLRREGRIHNYLRMLWGKKILEWSAHPKEALERMIELNNKYALDGRDPSSYSGIFWVLGRYDRPWAPARSIFGVVRYMSSDNTRRKLRVREYLARYA